MSFKKRKKHRDRDCCCIVEEVFDGDFCFVATASYGSADAPQVRVLRQYRDRVLRRSRPGRAFIRCYYRYGAYGARALRGRPVLKAAVRAALTPAVKYAQRRLSR